MIGKIFWGCFFLFLAFLFSGFPLLGISLLTILSTLETWQMQILGHPWVLADVGLILFLGGCFIRQLLMAEGDKTWFYTLLYVAVAHLLSSFFSLHPLLSILAALKLILYMAAAYFIGLYVKRTHFPIVQRVMVVALLISIVVSISRFYSAPSTGLFHARGGFVHWNDYAFFLVILLAGVLYWLHDAPRTHKGVESQQEVLREVLPEILRLLVFGLLVILLLFTRSRSGLFLLGCFLVLAGAAGMLKKTYLVGMAPLLIVLLIHGLQGEIDGMYFMKQWISSPYFQERIEHGRNALHLLTRHPWFGVGTGQLEAYMQWAYPETGYHEPSTGATLFTILAENGFAGALAYAWLWGTVFQHVCNRQNHSHSPENTLYVRSLLLVVALIGIGALVGPIHRYRFSWCLMGWVYGLAKKDSEG